MLTGAHTAPIARAVLRGAAVAATAIAVALTSALPASATPDMGEQAFQIFPPNYCAMSAGSWTTFGYPALSISAATHSRTSTDAKCQHPSPAPTNTFAARVRLEYRLGGGSYAFCGKGIHAVNAYGKASVYASMVEFACGHMAHRLHTEHRVTYGGVNTYSTRHSGTYNP